MLTAPAIRAVLFDIDGTLVDSNYLHVDAWYRAFEDVGHPVEAWRIHRAIGMDSDRLLTELLNDDADQLGAEAKHMHAAAYEAQTDRLRPFDGAHDLLERLLARGDITVVLATSAPRRELDILLKVLDLKPDRLLSTNADDVDTAKPDPGIVHEALARADVDADQALFVGDTVWDMIAAKKAGTRTVAVRSGGVGAGELMEAGADEVIRNVSDLLARPDWPRN